MASNNTHNVRWRFQGLKSSCWLTSIEMLMQAKHGNIYGEGGSEHSQSARAAFRKNSGSNIDEHAAHYGLERNDRLRKQHAAGPWANALRHGPVLAEGQYGWARFGVGPHVILIVGMSDSGQLAYFNPNMFAVLPHPKEKISYLSIDRCVALSDDRNDLSPFWQTVEDVEKQGKKKYVPWQA